MISRTFSDIRAALNGEGWGVLSMISSVVETEALFYIQHSTNVMCQLILALMQIKWSNRLKWA